MMVTPRAGLAAACLLLAASSLPAQLYLRGSTDSASGQIIEVSSAGVAIAAGTDAPVTIPWDRVRTVKGTPAAAQAAKFSAPAEALWRARTRVERNDFAGAEPILEKLSALPPDQAFTGPSAAVLAECLLRCRLERGAQAGAARAWLALSTTSAPTIIAATSQPRAARPLIDPATGLCPALPPMFVRDAALVSATDAPPAADTPAARLYSLAMLADAGRPADFSPALAAGLSENARVLADIVQARVAAPADRAAARSALLSRLAAPDLAPWLDAWCHVALGRSLIRETDPAQRRQGVLHLLQAPARLGRSAPYLASLALLEAADTMQSLGEPDAAAAIRAELKDRFSRWPAARASTADLPPVPLAAPKEPAAD